MNRGGGKAKGSRFERQVCHELSLWWSHGVRDDIFWRTAGSGGMATVRARAGKRTAGAYGDIAATCSQGEPLLRLCCFELKRGYGQWCLLDLIDKRAGRPCAVVAFWRQAKRSAEDAGARYPIVIFQRDLRRVGIIGPRSFLTALAPYAGPHRGRKLLAEIDGEPVFAMLLHDFFAYCPAEYIMELV